MEKFKQENAERAASPTTEVQRPCDHPTVQRAQERLSSCEQQVERLNSQLAEAREHARGIEERALAAEARGEDALGSLEAAQRRVATLEKLVEMAESPLARALSDRNRALAEVGRQLKNERIELITKILDKQEDLLWNVLHTQHEIDDAIVAAAADGISLGFPRSYSQSTFPGFPFIRSNEEILTWLRHRSIAPKSPRRP